MPVVLHRPGQADENATANVYIMNKDHWEFDRTDHNDIVYVRKCAASDLAHYDLQGIEAPTTISVEVTKIGTFEKIRTVDIDVANLRRGIWLTDEDWN